MPNRSPSSTTVAQHVGEPRRGEEEIEEPGPGDLDPGQVGHGRGLERGLHLARRSRGAAARRPGQGQGDVRGPVAVVPLLGRIQHDAGRRLGQTGGRERLLEGVTERVLDHGGDHKGTRCPRIGTSNFT